MTWLQAIRGTGGSELSRVSALFCLSLESMFGLNLSVTVVSIVRAIQNPRDGLVVMSVRTSANSFVVFPGDSAVSGVKNKSPGKAKPIFLYSVFSSHVFYHSPSSV